MTGTLRQLVNDCQRQLVPRNWEVHTRTLQSWRDNLERGKPNTAPRGILKHRLDNARGLRTSDARDVPYATTRRQHLSFLRQRQNSFKCILLSSPAGWWANLVASEPSGGRRRNARKGVGVPGKSYRLCLRNVLNPFDKNVVRRSTRTAKANISRKSAHTRAPSPPAAFTAGGGWGRVRAHESVGRKCPTQAGWYILL
jgi:hypothetical protein